MAVHSHADVWKHFPENWRGVTGMGLEEVSVSTFPTDRRLWGGGWNILLCSCELNFASLFLQECFPRQQKGGEVECGGHLQLAATGPFCLQGRLHGQCPADVGLGTGSWGGDTWVQVLLETAAITSPRCVPWESSLETLSTPGEPVVAV